MELTIKQALEKGITAHRKGNLNEAANIYRYILNTFPKHPDANHNLGLIAASSNKAEIALNLFKTSETEPLYAVDSIKKFLEKLYFADISLVKLVSGFVVFMALKVPLGLAPCKTKRSGCLSPLDSDKLSVRLLINFVKLNL